MKNNEYKCSCCGGIFQKAWSDEDAMAESLKVFREEDLADKAVVCCDCWAAITNLN